MLSEEEVKANAETYLRQVYRIVDREKTEVLVQSSWFDRFNLEDVIRLSARFTVAQMLRREDFAQRYDSHRPIGLHEFMYPLLQAYDSVEVRADVEFGGSDQRFNLLLGRELQEMMGQRPQSVFIMPLLVGTDGVQKMSKSLGNYIALEDPPGEMYGKVMSIPDTLIVNYFTLATDVPESELEEISEALEKRSVNPMELKMRLAREIVAQFYDAEAAREAEDGFTSTFQRREVPDDVLDYVLSADTERPASDSGQPTHDIPAIIYRAGLAPSASEAKRLIQQGAVEVDGQRIKGSVYAIVPGNIIKVGKRRFLRIVNANKAADSSPAQASSE
jgi:tyrosyl-tRNA synthetase